jgi:hypothetical protein
LNKGH